MSNRSNDAASNESRSDTPDEKRKSGLRRREVLAAFTALPTAVVAGSVLQSAGGGTPPTGTTTATAATATGGEKAATALTQRLRQLAPNALPLGGGSEEISNEDIIRILDLLGRGVPLHHRVKINGEVIGDADLTAYFGECPGGDMFSDGENADNWACLALMGSFTCEGGAGDDFECTGVFQCDTFDCEYSFDMSDCEGTFGASNGFCVEQFTVDGGFGCTEEHCVNGFHGGGGGGISSTSPSNQSVGIRLS